MFVKQDLAGQLGFVICQQPICTFLVQLVISDVTATKHENHTPQVAEIHEKHL